MIVPLRYRADWRSILFLFALVILFFVQWTALCRHWYLLPVTCVLAFTACVVKHNHIHCRTFSRVNWNRGFEYLLGFCTGQSTAAIIPVHTERHHGQNHSSEDCVRSTIVHFRRNWLNLVTFPFVAMWNVYRVKAQDQRRWQYEKPALYRRARRERFVVLGFIAVLLFLNWRATLLYLGVPWLFGQWGIVAINLLQHQDCDHGSAHDHSRNITGRLINWLFLNNGFHTAHHLRPAIHWSRLRGVHEKQIEPHMRPELNHRSLLISIWKQFFLDQTVPMNISPPDEVAGPRVACDGIDYSRPFMPEELTPFFFAPSYRTLTAAQRLRYNQLNALYFNEQTMFFEKTLARHVLGYFLSQSLPPELQTGLEQFLAEEQQHTEMFRHLNLRCAPEFYRHRDFHFIRIPPVGGGVLTLVSRRPRWFPFLLWLMHLQEERAMFFGRTFLKFADSLEPDFISVQRKHLADETGHVAWDEALLDWVWPQTNAWLRRVNIQALSWMVNEYFTTPKRTAPRILAELVKEFPGLRPQFPTFCRELYALRNDPAYRRSLYCLENVPKTFKRFDAWPEFQSIVGAMPGYAPGVNS